MARFAELREAVEQQSVLADGFLAQFVSAGGDIPFRAFRDRRTMNRFVFGLGNERCPHSFGLLEIGESGALSGNDISPRRASHYPNRTITLHPKAPRRVRQSGLVHLAGRGVALVQNDGLICLRHPQTVPVLVQPVNMCS